MDDTIYIQDVSTCKSVPKATLLEQWARLPLQDMERSVEVTIRIVDEEEGRELNKNWRNKDYATNVFVVSNRRYTRGNR